MPHALDPRMGMARPPRIPRALVGRIDRAARVAHRFHRFAHHPLCGAYASEVLRLGRRTRLCLGCTLAIAGLGAGLGAGVVLGWLAPGALHAPVRSCLAVAIAVLLALLARHLRRPARLTKVLGRGVAGALLGFVATTPLGFLLSALVAAGLLAAYRQQGPRRSACETCPERTLRVCSGMKVQVGRERAFRRLSGRWLSHLRNQA